MKRPIIMAGAIYAAGIEIVGASAHLRWWTGFGIWLAGLGFYALIILDND